MPGTDSPVSPLPESLQDITHFSLNSWEQMAQGLSSGEINAAFINIPQAMDLFEKGLDIALLMFTHRGGSRMICPPGIKRIPDFKGKSVLIPHTLSIQHMLLHKFMDAKGIPLSTSPSPETVCVETVPPLLMPEMMNRDKALDIAGFVCEAPFGATAVEQGPRQLLATRDLWPDHPSSAFVVRQSLLDAQAKEIQALVATFFRSAAKLNTGLDKGNKKKMDHPLLAGAADFIEQPEHLIGKALESAGAAYAPKLLPPDLSILNIIQEYMGQTMGLLSGAIDLEAFVRPNFARKALEDLEI